MMPPPAVVSGAALHAFLAYRKAPGERVYAVADAARDREMALAPRDEFDQPIYSLFDGDAPDYMHDVAPHLFSIDLRPKYPYHGSALLDRWAERLGSSTGILALCASSSRDTALHLRQVFRTTDEERRPFYFRFYDPRVLRAYLPTCTAADAARLFGPIRLIAVEAERPGVMLSYTRDPSGIQIAEIPLLASQTT